MSARILLVEDDPALLAMLKAALAYGGFESGSASRGSEAVGVLTAGGYDAVLLDLGLPDCDGGELLPMLRSLVDIPIIVVSGRGSEKDKVEALDLGADDYVAKPFLPGELLARIRAALRRYEGGSSKAGGAGANPSPRDPIRIGAMTLDPLDHTLTLHGRRTVLNGAEYRVLHILAQKSGSTVSREDLLAGLYAGAAPPETKVVDVYISRIRTKLRELPGGDDLIGNVRGQGWRLRPPAA